MLRSKTKGRSRRSCWHWGSGRRTATPEGSPGSRFRTRRCTGSSGDRRRAGLRPARRHSRRPSESRSRSKPYWKPEHPPPCTYNPEHSAHLRVGGENLPRLGGSAVGDADIDVGAAVHSGDCSIVRSPPSASFGRAVGRPESRRKTMSGPLFASPQEGYASPHSRTCGAGSRLRTAHQPGFLSMARTVNCVVLKQVAEGLEEPPLPGDLGSGSTKTSRRKDGANGSNGCR